MKYIIDIPSSQEYSYDKDFKSLDLKFHDDNFSGMTRFDAEPYTEPDRKAIEDEVWELTDRILRMSKKDTEQCFGYIFPTGITVNLSYQEAKSKYEAWLKQKDYRQDREKVIALADDIGIHNLYALVRDIRGE